MEVDSAMASAAASPLPQPLPSSSQEQPQQPSSHERSNFRRELYARSTDRSTVEDMADMVVHRYEIQYTVHTTLNHPISSKK